MSTARAYYNEHDTQAAAWLRELIKAGVIAPGDVDERDIREVQPSDLAPYTQCHFFAGIGGWSYALRLAGWPDDRRIWTGSCPCQPFSAAGRQQGTDDPRHLWPAWFRLIRESRPDVVVGEQVESAIRFGWLDLVSGDLEREGYAVGACVLGAHSVGAPHLRQRLYWVADATSQRRQYEPPIPGGDESLAGEGAGGVGTGGSSHFSWVAESECGAAERYRLTVGSAAIGVSGEARQRERLRDDARDGGDALRLADSLSAGRPEGRTLAGHGSPAGGCEPVDLGQPLGERLERLTGHGDDGHGPGRVDARQAGSVAAPGDPRGVAESDADAARCRAGRAGEASDGRDAARIEPAGLRDAGAVEPARADHVDWRDSDWLLCRDGKFRPVVASHVGVSDGLPAVLVRGGDADSEEAKDVDGQTSQTNATEGVPSVQAPDDSSNLPWMGGGSRGVHAPGVLRQGVHGGGDAEGSVRESQSQPSEGASTRQASLRTLRKDGQTPRSSCGRGPFQQHAIELADVVRQLPSAYALAKLHRRDRDAEALHILCAAICESGAVPLSFEQAPAVWQSLSCEDQDWIRMDLGYEWVARAFTPLSKGEPNRVARLRGYGNAIVPHVAAAFMKAYCAARS